ncbi:YetF domain-containing protein [Pseudofrankia sp. DC12]|uniref:DUF421 domain-containing protein n=1 Tax=Pseudofrankia sp. DC12 TaxID=683315 RepID=UPI000A04A292|nr:YetF domain-containing protein [Pseudofrankia sp. DC12]
MLSDLFTMGIPVMEKVIRTVAVYVAMTVLIRAFGKREMAQLNTHDLVVMLLVSNVVQNAIIGNDNSLTGGVIGALTLFVVNGLAVRLLRDNARAERLFEGTPTVLIADGRFDDRALRREGLRRGDVERALRVQGADDVTEVESATIAPGGAIVVELRAADQSASRGDLADLRGHVDARLDEISRALARLTPS